MCWCKHSTTYFCTNQNLNENVPKFYIYNFIIYDYPSLGWCVSNGFLFCYYGKEKSDIAWCRRVEQYLYVSCILGSGKITSVKLKFWNCWQTVTLFVTFSSLNFFKWFLHYYFLSNSVGKWYAFRKMNASFSKWNEVMIFFLIFRFENVANKMTVCQQSQNLNLTGVLFMRPVIFYLLCRHMCSSNDSIVNWYKYWLVLASSWTNQCLFYS